jgi:hypothetical protein
LCSNTKAQHIKAPKQKSNTETPSPCRGFEKKQKKRGCRSVLPSAISSVNMDELFADDTFILLTKDKALKEKIEEKISESGGAVARSITKRVNITILLSTQAHNHPHHIHYHEPFITLSA